MCSTTNFAVVETSNAFQSRTGPGFFMYCTFYKMKLILEKQQKANLVRNITQATAPGLLPFFMRAGISWLCRTVPECSNLRSLSDVARTGCP